MISSGSSDVYMSRVVKRYSSLFTLPSHTRIVLLLSVLCMFGGVLAIFPLHTSYYGFALGLIFGALFLFTTFSSDLMIYHGYMRSDPTFNLRRCSALSFFSCLIWFGFISIGSIISAFLKNPDIWIKLFLLGFCAALILRFLVLSTLSFTNYEGIILSSLSQPALCAIPPLLMSSIIGYGLEASTLIFLPLSILIAGLTAYLFTLFVNRVGRGSLGMDSLPLFRAFMANWAEDLNAPLESSLERLGSERDIRFSIMAFKAGEKIKAVMVVPAFHPGPFKNVGSSLLPYMIQEALENRLQCVVSVPHGLSGHELDLSSQLQNRKVVEEVLGSINFPTFYSSATPFVRIQRDGGSASCQIFGSCALLTLTTAPKTMEDLPQELDSVIVNEANKRGLSATVVVDAHNSIEGAFNLNEAVGALRKAAVTSLERALNHRRSPLEIGAAKVVPKEFSVKEGMGLGGISAIVTRVGNQKSAYVTIDGNNMVSGLRERILSSLQEIGIDDGEILTTDTHAVNGVVLTPRGYHPVGEAMDQKKLIDYIEQAVTRALNDLDPAEVSWRTEVISNIKVIGERQIEELCLLAEKTAKQAKKLAITIFPIAGILLTALLTLL